MANMQFDPEDIGLFVAGILASGVMTGIVTVTAFGWSMSDQLLSLGSGSISLAYVVSAATMVGIVVTNDNTDLFSADGWDKLQNSDMAEYYAYTIVAAVGLLLAWAFLPSVAQFFQSSDVWGIVFIAINAAASAALGWMY